jgi:hypothetical protein
MDTLDDYYHGHPYINVITALADLPGNWATNCSHWGLLHNKGIPFMIEDNEIIDDSATTGYLHDLFGFHWDINLEPPGLNLEYPLRAVLIPTVIDGELQYYVHNIGGGVLGGDSDDPYSIWSFDYSWQGTKWGSYGDSANTVEKLLRELVNDCINNEELNDLNICPSPYIL